MEDGRLVHTLRLTAGGKASKSLSRGGSIFGGGSASFRLPPLGLGKTLRDSGIQFDPMPAVVRQ